MKKPIHVNRRQFAAGSAAAGLAALTPLPALAMGKTALGSKEIMVLSDGNLALPLSFVFPDVPQEEVKMLLAESGQDVEMLSPDCNITLVRDGDRLVIFDVGAGPNFMPTAGILADSLSEAGVDPSQVTDVVFTHAHPDHIWGLVDDFDELVFPDAAYHINRTEWDYWRKDDTLEKTPEARKSFVVGARSRFEYLSDQINLFGFGDEVLPGIEAVDTSGHTPGHMAYMLESEGEQLLLMADTANHYVWSLAYPDWEVRFDRDKAQAAASRRKILGMTAADRIPVVGYHMPFPATGFVEARGDGFRWQPTSYQLML